MVEYMCCEFNAIRTVVPAGVLPQVMGLEAALKVSVVLLHGTASIVLPALGARYAPSVGNHNSALMLQMRAPRKLSLGTAKLCVLPRRRRSAGRRKSPMPRRRERQRLRVKSRG